MADTLSQLEKHFFINAGKDGTFADSGDYFTTPEDIDELYNYLNTQDIEKLILYCHGGLVSEKSGVQVAELMKSKFASLPDKRHVVSMVWETGPLETVMQNLGELKDLAGKDVFNEVLKFVIKLVGKKLGLDDTARGGGTYLSDETIHEEKTKSAPFEDLDKTLNARGGVGASLDEDNEDEFYARLEGESNSLIRAEGTEELKTEITDEEGESARGGLLFVAKVVAQIAFNVLKRYFKKTDHDFYPTVMEEAFKKLYLDKVGTWGWGQMKNKAAKLFADNDGLNGKSLHAGTYFLQMLDKYHSKRIAEGKKFDIELIGHSAGSIVICHLLERTQANFKNLKYNNVFFLAPACRTDLFLQHGKPAYDDGYFKKFKMFTMKEENEKKDHCIPYVYTHSLLYMVSGLFEMPEIDARIMGLHGQFRKDGRYSMSPESVNLNTFMINKQVVLSDDITNQDVSMWSSALKHGAFDNDEHTLASILKSL
jgi:hypothetical protein